MGQSAERQHVNFKDCIISLHIIASCLKVLQLKFQIRNFWKFIMLMVNLSVKTAVMQYIVNFQNRMLFPMMKQNNLSHLNIFLFYIIHFVLITIVYFYTYTHKTDYQYIPGLLLAIICSWNIEKNLQSIFFLLTSKIQIKWKYQLPVLAVRDAVIKNQNISK